MTQENEPEATEAPRLPPGNADRGGPVEEQFYAWREHAGSGPVSVGTPTPFQTPPLVSTRFTGYLLVGVRVALVLWAVALGIETRRVRLAESSDPGSIDALMVVGVGLGIAWLVVGACWSDQRTRNILRLEGHYPTRARAIRAWVFPAAWVALISFTLLKVEPNPDFDWRPMVIVAGFVITSWIPYQLIRRLFRSLVRVVPDAAILVLYVLDLIASGLLWWWFITWIDTDVATDSSTLALLASAAFAAAMALFVAAILVWYIDRAADRGQVMRERTIRTRHDHRVARLQGLDPLDPATRWALYLARQAADRGAAVHLDPVPVAHPEPALPAKRSRSRQPTTAPPEVEVERPAARISQPVEPEPAPSPQPAPTAVDPDRVPIRALRRGTGAAASPEPPSSPTYDAAPTQPVEQSGTSGIRRRLAAARATSTGDSGDDWPSDEALAAPGRPRTITEQLAARLGAELAAGGVGDFAATARELSEHYPSTAHSDPPDGFEAVDASGEIAARPTTSRFVVMELLRYLALLLLLTGAVACGWLFLGVVDIDPDAPDTVEPVEHARRVATYALATSHVLMLGWLLAAACYARRLGVRMSRLTLGVLCGASVACLGAALAVDDFRFRAASVLALMVATVALIIGLRAFSASQVALGDATSATNVWIGVAAATACLVLLGPLRTPISLTTKSNELIFFAALCGLAMVVEAVLSALSMSEFENTLRASNRPAVIERQSAIAD